jgi:Flp pilus assembly protein TadG
VRSDGGQALVEFSLVFGVLVLLLMAIIDMGFMLSDILSVRQGVSSTARQAAVGKIGSNSSCTLTGVGGASTNVKDLLCLAHSLDGVNNDSITRVAIVIGDTSSSTYTVGKQVTICEEYALRSLSGFLSPILSGHVATSITSVRADTLVTGGLVSAQETALTGASWSFCKAPAPVS